MAKVALVQNHIGLDGRSQILISVTELLKARGDEVDILTFSGEEDAARFRSLATGPLEFGLRTYKRPRFLVGDLLQEVAVPYLFARDLGTYDLVMTSNTGVAGYPSGVNLLHMVCFPLEQVPAYEARYQEPSYRLYGLLNKLLYRIANHRCKYSGKWLAISDFTRDVMLDTYPLSAEDIEIVYPPADTTIVKREEPATRSVVSIGGFHADKRQLEQIELARRLPDVQFYLIGSARSVSYFKKCQEAAEKLPNVELIPNASNAQVKHALSRAKVFLHYKHYEHFGIGTVEGIAHGCIPIVHDSGGQREIVPFGDLRFQDQESAVACLRAALDGEFDGLLPELQSHIARFSSESFKAAMTRVFDEVLPARSTQHTS